jgi:Ni/Fe-hydrogenase 1 B-type cytochrome subunit
MTTTTMEKGRDAPENAGVRAPVYVYAWPMRVWHWVMTLALIVLGVTGWFIARPLADWGTGWPRLLHMVSGDVLAISMVGRVYWAIVGGPHAREIFIIPVWKKEFWVETKDEVLYYLFIKKGRAYVGHNPLARLSMFGMFVLITLFMIVSGFAIYGEDTPGGGMDRAFGWVFTLLGSSQTVRTWHHLGMWGLALFTCIHLYLAVRADIMGPTTVISTMVNGWRFFKVEKKVKP